jgi:prepilin-type N-terminal cleavage/methylation domain-containing protein
MLHKGRKGHNVVGGFTLLELLLAIAIIAVLVALQLPVFARAQLEAQKVECRNYKRQLIQYYYMSDFEDGSPPYTIQPLMQVTRMGGKCYNCHASAP